ncbi:RND transporter [Thermaurantimonas aggregans]|uniref:RND transporter n=1 Tax=Thermaurantimonas aggregans TaxID=2173829 RepID=A0A401XNV3_9FLAO|nr:TolC family protein [Thermaurantimonas aggregans]MCX8148855.1 TolC family protein [Thermaurantimonas aggregans]GCD78672.1 RND transporter [Thermaurantimonas aggregans]
MKLLKNQLLLFTFLLFKGVSGQDTLLSSLINKALTHHPTIQIARNNLKIADLQNSIGQAGMLPRLDVTSGANQSIQNTDLEFFSGQKNSATNAKSRGFSTNVRLEWMIFDGLRMFALKNELRLQELIAQNDVKEAIESVMFDLFTAYYSIVLQKSILNHTENNLKISQNRRDLALAKYTAGKISSFEYLQAQRDFNQDSSAYLNELLILKRLKARLERLTGENIPAENFVNVALPDIEIPSKEEWLAKLKTQNTALQSIRLRKLISESRQKEQLADFMPHIGVFGEYNLNRQQNEIGVLKSLASNGTNAGLMLRWNLFNGMIDRNRRKAALLESENAELQAKNLELELIELFENTYQQLASNYAIYQLELKNQQTVEDQTSIAESQYRMGKISDLEFRNAQTSLLNSKIRKEEAYLNSLVSYLQLMLITGQLSANNT